MSATIMGIGDDGCSRFNISSSTNTVCPAPGEILIISCFGFHESYVIRSPDVLLSENMNATMMILGDIDNGTYVCDSGPPSNDIATLNVIVGPFTPTTKKRKANGMRKYILFMKEYFRLGYRYLWFLQRNLLNKQ